jgi:hypothetical protein
VGPLVEPAEPLLNSKQATDLAGLLGTVSEQDRLGREYRDEADYWASQVDPRLAAEDARTIAWLLRDVAGSPWLPEPVGQWARAWAANLEDLTGGTAAT